MRPRLAGVVLAILLAAPAARATDLLDVWRAAAAHDPEFSAARAARAAGQARREQAGTLWRPSVALQAGVARASAETAMRGAQFAAPGFGQSTGVAFDTSVTGGTSSRYALSLRQPLYDRERSAQSEQLRIAGDAAERQWQAAQQSLILRAAQRYFEAALAAQQLRLATEQLRAVEQARVEADDRFRIGDRPVIDVHEASARAAALRAQLLAAQSELEIRRGRLADLMGAAPSADLPLPAAREPQEPEPLAAWLARAQRDNPQVLLAEAQLRNAEQEARKTAAALSPTLDAVAQLGRERLSGTGDFGGASTTSSQRAVGVQLTVPLYTGGMRSAKQAEAVALVEQARAELERAREQAVQQTRSAWLELSVARGRTAALDSAWRASLARLDATQVGLQAGDRTTLDLLNARNDASAAELALLQARVQQLLQRLQLAAAAGALDESLLAAANRELASGPAGTAAPLAAMVAFDASYIPALQATTQAAQDPQAAAGAKSALASLGAQWPLLRARLEQAWGPTPPAGWAGTLQAVDAQLASAAHAAGRPDWSAAHEALEQVRLRLAHARRAQAFPYFVDQLTAFHEPMEVLALAGAKTKPGELTPARRAELGHAYEEAVRLWGEIEDSVPDPVQYGLTPAREAQLRQGMAQERAALGQLGQALRGNDAPALLKAAAAIKPPFARVFTAFGRAPPERPQP